MSGTIDCSHLFSKQGLAARRGANELWHQPQREPKEEMEERWLIHSLSVNIPEPATTVESSHSPASPAWPKASRICCLAPEAIQELWVSTLITSSGSYQSWIIWLRVIRSLAPEKAETTSTRKPNTPLEYICPPPFSILFSSRLTMATLETLDTGTSTGWRMY